MKYQEHVTQPQNHSCYDILRYPGDLNRHRALSIGEQTQRNACVVPPTLMGLGNLSDKKCKIKFR